MTHKIDPSKYDYTCKGRPVTDLQSSMLTGYSYPWYSKDAGISWTDEGQVFRCSTTSYDLVPTPKAKPASTDMLVTLHQIASVHELADALRWIVENQDASTCDKNAVAMAALRHYRGEA